MTGPVNYNMTSPETEQEFKLTPEQFTVFRGFLNRMIADGIIICRPIAEDAVGPQTRLAVQLMQEKINSLAMNNSDGSRIILKPNGKITFETIRAFSIANTSDFLNPLERPTKRRFVQVSQKSADFLEPLPKPGPVIATHKKAAKQIPVIATHGKAEVKRKSINSPFSLAHPPIIGHKPAYNFGVRREEYITIGGEVVAAHSHRGIDISCPGGTKVYSTTSGEVVKVDKDPGGKGGNYVVIRDNAGLFHHYMHMGSMSVRTGQFVSAGTRIGDVARTGFARGSRSPIHLHYEIRSGVNSGRAINFTGALREAYRQHEQTATLQVR